LRPRSTSSCELSRTPVPERSTGIYGSTPWPGDSRPRSELAANDSRGNPQSLQHAGRDVFRPCRCSLCFISTQPARRDPEHTALWSEHHLYFLLVAASKALAMPLHPSRPIERHLYSGLVTGMKRTQKGFSVIELMAVMAAVFVMLGVAVIGAFNVLPSFRA